MERVERYGPDLAAYGLSEEACRDWPREYWRMLIKKAAYEWQAWKYGAEVQPSPCYGHSWYDVLEAYEVAYLQWGGRSDKEVHADINKWVDKVIMEWEGKEMANRTNTAFNEVQELNRVIDRLQREEERAADEVSNIVWAVISGNDAGKDRAVLRAVRLAAASARRNSSSINILKAAKEDLEEALEEIEAEKRKESSDEAENEK